MNQRFLVLNPGTKGRWLPIFLIAVMLGACTPASVVPPPQPSPPAAPLGLPGGAPAAPASPGAISPQLVEEGYRGFNIVRLGEIYFGLPQAVGAFSLQAASRGDYVAGTSIAEVRSRLDQQADQTAETAADRDPETPQMVQADYRKYNLVRYRHETFAVPRDGSKFDPAKAAQGDYLSAASLATLRVVVAAKVRSDLEADADNQPLLPQLIDGDVNGYNLIRYNHRTYAIQKGEGTFDSARFDSGGYTAALVGASSEELIPRLLAGSTAGPAASPGGSSATVVPSPSVARP